MAVSFQPTSASSTPTLILTDEIQPVSRPVEENTDNPRTSDQKVIENASPPNTTEDVGNPNDGTDDSSAQSKVSTVITRRLYISHFLSTWNSRSFQFAAVLFLATIFPATLLPLSIYALVRSVSAILLAPIIGHAIDTRSRLPVVRFSIGKLLPTLILLELCSSHGA